MNARALTLVMVATVLAITIAFGLKWQRYTAPVVRMDDTFETRLTKFLVDRSWQRQSDDPNTKNNAVQIIAFRKSGCTDPIRVSIVGMTSGLESYLRQTFGDDLAFVQYGAVLPRPSLLRFQLYKTWRSVVSMAFAARAEHRPILAIIPAPKRQTSKCDGPSVLEWEAF